VQVLIDSLPIVARFIPNVKYLIAGPGDSEDFMKEIDPQQRNRIKFLGRLTDEDKASFLKSIKIYVAPNTGGESFGIILTEALSAGTAVVASDIPAFKAVLENGEAGALFINEDSEDLAKTLVSMLKDDEKRNRLASYGKLSAQKYDWQVVAEQIESVYEMAIAGGQRVTLASENRFWNRK
jgi:phosphatidylinositol alpha-mannosyltransferase